MAPKKSETPAPETGAEEKAKTTSGATTAAAKDKEAPDDGGTSGGLTQEQVDELVEAARKEGRDSAYNEGLERGASDAQERFRLEHEGKKVLTVDELDKLLADAKQEGFRSGYTEALDDDRTDAPSEAGITQASIDWAKCNLIATVLRMPESLRRGGIARQVDDLAGYLDNLPDQHRQPAGEFIRAIAESRPADIVSGQFKLDVDSALNVMDGVDEYRNTTVTSSDQRAAAMRLASLASNPRPAGFGDQQPAPQVQNNGEPFPAPFPEPVEGLPEGYDATNPSHRNLYGNAGGVQQ